MAIPQLVKVLTYFVGAAVAAWAVLFLLYLLIRPAL